MTAVGTLWRYGWCRKRIGRGPAAAAFFFVGTLFPVLGFMNAYGMLFSYVWDHWVYLPSLGLIALGAALVARAAKYLREPVVPYAFAAIVLPGLAILTWRQCGNVCGHETLWRVTIDRNPNAWIAYNNLGNALLQKGNVDEAIAYYQKALEIKPDLEKAHYNPGNALFHKGKWMKRSPSTKGPLQINPDYAEAHNNLGNALIKKGNGEEAITRYRKALEINPDLAEAQSNLACVLATLPQASLRNGSQAVELARRAVATEHGGKNPIVLQACLPPPTRKPASRSRRRAPGRRLNWRGQQGGKAWWSGLNGELKLYEAGLPFHQESK